MGPALDDGPAAGPGGDLRRRGHRIVALEPGARLAGLARDRLDAFPLVELRSETFEDHHAPSGTYDAVYAATAWHWTDPATRYARAARMLRPGGALALWGYEQAFPVGFDALFTELQEAYASIGQPWSGPWPPPPPEDNPGWSTEMDGTGLFAPASVRRYVWEERYDAEGLIALLDSFSANRILRQEQRDVLFDAVRRLLDSRPAAWSVATGSSC